MQSSLPRTLKRLAFGLVPMLVWLCALGGGAIVPDTVQAEESFSQREAKIKAAYLYQFIRYVTWPNSAFEDSKSPLVIGAVGTDPVNDYIRRIAAQRNAGNRPLVFLQVATVEDAQKCHILFVPDSTPTDNAKALLSSVEGKSVLAVSELAPNVLPGGVITFVIAGNNVRLQLSLKSATGRGLKISSQLAKIATVVD